MNWKNLIENVRQHAYGIIARQIENQNLSPIEEMDAIELAFSAVDRILDAGEDQRYIENACQCGSGIPTEDCNCNFPFARGNNGQYFPIDAPNYIKPIYNWN